jgi:hypothetical protein
LLVAWVVLAGALLWALASSVLFPSTSRTATSPTSSTSSTAAAAPPSPQVTLTPAVAEALNRVAGDASAAVTSAESAAGPGWEPGAIVSSGAPDATSASTPLTQAPTSWIVYLYAPGPTPAGGPGSGSVSVRTFRVSGGVAAASGGAATVDRARAPALLPDGWPTFLDLALQRVAEVEPGVPDVIYRWSCPPGADSPWSACVWDFAVNTSAGSTRLFASADGEHLVPKPSWAV